MNRRKGLSTKTSSNDQSVIKYVYYNYDPEEIESLKFTFTLGATCLKGANAGEITLKNGLNSNSSECAQSGALRKAEDKFAIIKYFDTGSVESIGSSLQKVSIDSKEYYVVKKSIGKKAVLQLFEMRLCEHIPDESKLKKLLQEQSKSQEVKSSQIKSSEIKSSKSRKVQKVQPIYCRWCEQRLLYFYLPEQKSVTFGEIQKQLQLQDSQQQVNNCQWTVMLGQKFTQTTPIAKFNQNQFFLNQTGKISHLTQWSSLQNATKSTQVLRYRPIYCQHQKIQSNTCQYCFQQVDPIQLNLRKFLFQMQQKDQFKRQMITTGSTLIEQENKFVDQLLERERGILILDLDNTVLHSIELGQIHESRLEEMEEFYQLMIGHSIFNKFIVTSCFIVKMRPFFKEFIQAATNYYEIYVYTKGTRNYAEEICNAIRNQYADKGQLTNNRNEKIQYFEFLKDKNAFTPSRIITRDEDPDLERKSLNNILPTRQENLMVMDDLSSVWSYSAAVLYTVPYHYFFKKKILEQQKSRRNNNNFGKNAMKMRNSHKALDESKEGQKLKPVEDLYVENEEPVRELPCDHFQREVKEIQRELIEPANELPCDILERQVEEIQKNQIMVQSSIDSHGNIQQKIFAVETIQQQYSPSNVIEITQAMAPGDKEYQYDILPRNDFYLLFATNNLIQIHKKFFAEKKTQKPIEKKMSFAQMHRKLKFQILDGTIIKFCMKNETKIDIYGRAMKLGCRILSPNDTETPPQYLIRLNSIKSNIHRMYFKKDQEQERKSIFRQQSQIQGEIIKQLKYYSQTLKVPVVSESWIDFCYSFTYKFPIQPFIIDADDVLKDVHEEDYEWVIEEKGRELLKEIRRDNEEVERLNGEAKRASE